MNEKLYTIEINDALKEDDECLFCYLERKLEQNALAFVLGSSYMESDIREQTDKLGFCRNHTKMMFQYGNQLGNAWILKTRFHQMNQELTRQMSSYHAPKLGFFDKRKKKEDSQSALAAWLRKQGESCYVCQKVEETYERMLNSFLYLLEKDNDFLSCLSESKGFCFHHFAHILELCETKLNDRKKEEVLPLLFDLMRKNAERIQRDIDWFVEKNDYRNGAADWRQSKDAVQRTMQKLTGGYPADPVFKKQ